MQSTTQHSERESYSGAAREATAASPRAKTFPSSPSVTHPLPLLPILPTLTPAAPLGFPPTCPRRPLPCLPGQAFPPLLRTALLPLFIWFPFSKCWRRPHGVVFVTSLLLPFIITERWSPCVFSNVV